MAEDDPENDDMYDPKDFVQDDDEDDDALVDGHDDGSVNDD